MNITMPARTASYIRENRIAVGYQDRGVWGSHYRINFIKKNEVLYQTVGYLISV